MTITVKTERDIAARFVAARGSARALLVYPGQLPESLQEAYRIQDHAISAMGHPVAGWKVGRIGPLHAARYGAERLAGPVFARAIQRATAGSIPSGVVYPGGYGAVEAEFLFRLRSAPVVAERQLTADETAAFVESVHVGLEIASSPFPGINDHGPAVTASDFGNNNGLIIGPEIPNWQQSRMSEWTVVTMIDGRQAGAGRGADTPGGPLASIQFIIAHLAGRGIAVPGGTWVSSGAITGVHRVRAGERVTASFGRQLTVQCQIEHAMPQT